MAGDDDRIAFIIGVIPLVIATGAGGAARQSIGTAVFGGMVLASFVGILFIGPLFVEAMRLSAWRQLAVHSDEKTRT